VGSLATPPLGADTITTALGLLGPDGLRWQGGNGHKNAAYTPPEAVGGGRYCVMGALIAAAPDFGSYETAWQAVKDVVGGNVARWNNSPYTDFAVVQLTLRRAANNLREAAL
jgi:hypothetical protein